ncbi:hypothetical protein ACLOJK_020729 [Asimina triloba]
MSARAQNQTYSGEFCLTSAKNGGERILIPNQTDRHVSVQMRNEWPMFVRFNDIPKLPLNFAITIEIRRGTTIEATGH